MKKLALLILLMMIFQSSVFSRPVVFNDDGKFGLKDENGNIVVKAEYKKLIRLGESGWIIQKGSTRIFPSSFIMPNFEPF